MWPVSYIILSRLRSRNNLPDPEVGCSIVGVADGSVVDSTVGDVGAADGTSEGTGVGSTVGSALGWSVGVTDGIYVGRIVGSPANSSIKIFFAGDNAGEIDAATDCLNVNSARGSEWNAVFVMPKSSCETLKER